MKEEMKETMDVADTSTPDVSKATDNAAPAQAPGAVSGVKQSENDNPKFKGTPKAQVPGEAEGK